MTSNKYDRRDFLKLGGKAALAMGMASFLPHRLLAQQPKGKHLVILHTNDVHSQIDPFPANHPRFANKGGAARRASLVSRIRKQYDNNVLLLDAGDMFQGTPYFNFYKGEVELKTMSDMGYDAGTMGNHDFDNGVDGLASVLHFANFPLLVANYDLSRTPLAGKTKPYQVFVKDGIRVGVFGLGIELDGLVSKKMYQETVYLDPIETAQKMADKLRNEERCDLVIALSHLGYNYERNPEKVSDLKLAAATKGIDLIIGGHTHTFMEQPTQVKNAAGQVVLVTQAGFGGLQLGRVDFFLEEPKGKKDKKTSQYRWTSEGYWV